MKNENISFYLYYSAGNGRALTYYMFIRWLYLYKKIEGNLHDRNKMTK